MRSVPLIRFCPCIIALVFSFLATFLHSEPVQASENVKILMQRAKKINRDIQNTTPSPSETSFRLILLIDEIMDKHPSSMEALMLQRGRLESSQINIVELRAASAQWEKQNRGLAQRIRLRKTAAQRDLEQVSNRDAQPPRSSNDASRPRLTDMFEGIPKRSEQDEIRTVRTGFGNGAQKMTKAQVFQNLRKATVLLYFVSPGSENTSEFITMGTGFFISPTQILTNAHVAEHSNGYRGSWLAVNETIGVRPVVMSANAQTDSTVKIDAALMRTINYESSHMLPLNITRQPDTWIGLAGYPGVAGAQDSRYQKLLRSLDLGQKPPKKDIPTAVVVEGLINNVIPSRFTRAIDLQYTAETAPGNSGSPVVNPCGEVVGLHYSGTRSKVESDMVSAIKFNMAISAKDVSLFLNQMEVEVSTRTQKCQVAY